MYYVSECKRTGLVPSIRIGCLGMRLDDAVCDAILLWRGVSGGYEFCLSSFCKQVMASLSSSQSETERLSDKRTGRVLADVCVIV